MGAPARSWGRWWPPGSGWACGWGGVSHSDSRSARSRMVTVRDSRRAECALPLPVMPGAQLRKRPWLGSSREGARPPFRAVGSGIPSRTLRSWLPTQVSSGMTLSVTPWLRLGIQMAVASCAGPGWPRLFCSPDPTLLVRGALSSQPLAPTRHGKPSAEGAPTKENARQPWRTASLPQGQRTHAPAHAHRRPGPPAACQTPEQGKQGTTTGRRSPAPAAPAELAGALPGASGWTRARGGRRQGPRH